MTAEIKKFPRIKDIIDSKRAAEEDRRAREDCDKLNEAEMLNFLFRHRAFFMSLRNSNYDTGTGRNLEKAIMLTGAKPFFKIKLTIEEVRE